MQTAGRSPAADQRVVPVGAHDHRLGLALALAEVDPAHHDAILARGRAYGESRLVCNVHWQSDIIEGRFMGAAVVSQEHGVAEFRADIEAARHELAEARAKKLAPDRDCAAEAEALTQKIPGVL